MKKNPFFNRGGINEPEYFFGRKGELTQIYSHIQNSQSVSLVGPRRIGKSSLLLNLTPLREQLGVTEMLNDCLFTYISLEGRVNITKNDFYRVMANEVLKLVPGPIVPAEWYERIRGMREIDFERLIEFLELITGAGKRVVYLFDEFELTTINPNLDADFFTALRSIANLPKISFIVSTKDSLVNLVSSKTIPSSPFFNIFTTVRLDLFKQEEAEGLIINLSEEFLKDELPFILKYAGGHPFFIQLIAYYVFELKSQKIPLDEQDYEVIKEQVVTQAKPHFDYYWNNMSEGEKNALFETVKGESPRSNVEAIESLLNKCLLLKIDSKYSVFSCLFEEFVKEEYNEIYGY